MESKDVPKIPVIEKYEIKPGLDVLDYFLSWFSLNRFAKKVTASEHKFFLDVSSGVDRAILTSGAFEKAILEIIQTVCTGTNYTDQMIDIGANIGNHSVSLSGFFKNIASVEPNPVIFKVLEANILRNSIKNVQCYNFGLAEKASSATLVATSANHSLGKVKQHSTLGADAFNIEDSDFDIEHAIQLESVSVFFTKFSGLNQKTFIKIDVEGMEQEILSQLVPFIHAEEPIVGFEWYVREQPGIKDIIASLPNYTAYVIDSNDHIESNLFAKAFHLLRYGRKFSMKPYKSSELADSYPLVLLIPTKLNLQSFQPGR
jgi:FkbM family methyltransferase